MAEVTFGSSEGAAPPPVIDVPATATTPTTQVPAAGPQTEGSQCTALSVVPKTGTDIQKFILDDYCPGFKDIILPRLNIAQALGEIGKTFDAGTIVFGGNLALWTPPIFDKKTGNPIRAAGPPLTICCLGYHSLRFVEKVQGGGGMIVNSEAEVRANGGTLDYNEWKLKKAAGMRRFEYLMDTVIAVKRPEHIPDDGKTFVFAVGKDKYVIALWALKGAAYTAAIKGFFNREKVMGCMREGLATWHVYLTTRMKPFKTPEGGDGEAWIPVLVAAEKSNDEFLQFAAGVKSSS